MIDFSKNLPQVLAGKTRIRFQDCDPFNHLNNARYIDYFLNVREDSLLQQYALDIFEFARVEQKAWVVKSNQIAYFQPARVMEEVLVESQAFAHGDKDLWVEMRMINQDRSRLKALLWSHFVFFNLKKKDLRSILR